MHAPVLIDTAAALLPELLHRSFGPLPATLDTALLAAVVLRDALHTLGHPEAEACPVVSEVRPDGGAGTERIHGAAVVVADRLLVVERAGRGTGRLHFQAYPLIPPAADAPREILASVREGGGRTTWYGAPPDTPVPPVPQAARRQLLEALLRRLASRRAVA